MSSGIVLSEAQKPPKRKELFPKPMQRTLSKKAGTLRKAPFSSGAICDCKCDSSLRKRSFTLLELMVAITLLLLAGGWVGVKMHRALDHKRFHSNLDRLHARLIDCRMLATNTQSDWKGILVYQQKEWTFTCHSIEDSRFDHFQPLHLGSFSLEWNKQSKKTLSFLFTATGEVLVGKQVNGILTFTRESFQTHWSFPELFHLAESKDGKKIGPLHPEVLHATSPAK